MTVLQPVDIGYLQTLVEKEKATETRVAPFWFIGPEGEPYFICGKPIVPLMTGLRFQPSPELPEFEIIAFEQFDELEGITVVRVRVLEETEEPEGLYRTTVYPYGDRAGDDSSDLSSQNDFLDEGSGERKYANWPPLPDLLSKSSKPEQTPEISQKYATQTKASWWRNLFPFF